MNIKNILVLFSLLFSVSSYAYEAECPENAIDAMEDEDLFSHCDYSKQGLNGRLKEFFAEQNAPKSHRSSDAVTVYEKPAESAKSAMVTQSVVVKTDVIESTDANEPVKPIIYNIREGFSLANGPVNAMNGLYRQMAKYCPAGWNKLAEWSEPNAQSYYLHYQFQCVK